MAIFNLSHRLNEYMQRSNLSYADLCSKTKISKNILYGISKGKNNPSVENVIKISYVLNIEPEILACDHSINVLKLAICDCLEKLDETDKERVLQLMEYVLVEEKK